jgi:hypothetical protein
LTFELPLILSFIFFSDPTCSEHDSLLSDYRRCNDLHDCQTLLSSLESTLRTEAHALELDRALQGKNASGNSEDAKAYADLASRTELWTAHIETLSLELHVERLKKEWCIYAPDSEVANSSADSSATSAMPVHGVRFSVSWETSRHSGRRELFFAFHARLDATPFTLRQTSDAGNSPPERLDHAPLLLLDVSDADQSRVDSAAIEQLRAQLGGPLVTQRRWAWWLAFLSSHPTDLAVSAVACKSNLCCSRPSLIRAYLSLFIV